VVPEPGNPQAFNRYAYVLNNPLRYTDPTGHYDQEYGYNRIEEFWFRARGYQLAGTRSGWQYTGGYDLNLSDPNDVAYAVGTGEDAGQNVLIMVNGTGAERGYRGQFNNFNNLAQAVEKKHPGIVAFNLNYSVPGCDGATNLVKYDGSRFSLLGYDVSAAYGAALLAEMTRQIEATNPGTNIFVAGHSKGATVVNRAMKGPGGERITAGATVSLPWFESIGQPGNQFRVTPVFDAASNPVVLALCPALSTAGFVIPAMSRTAGHESPLNEYWSGKIAGYFAGF